MIRYWKRIDCLLMACGLVFTLSCSKTDDEVSGSRDSGGQTTSDSATVSVADTLSEDALLDTIQKRTINYFTEFAESESGAARERYLIDSPETDEHLVSTGGSGFGLMNLIVGMNRGWLTHEEGTEQIGKILDFFDNADRFHGAWPHWLNGSDGKVVPFSDEDNGGDLVETSYLAQALIIVYEYLKNGDAQDTTIANQANTMWKAINWKWYADEGNVLYWHWSKDYGWEDQLKIEGFNECLITYIMAAASPDSSITKATYTEGWCRSGAIVSDNKAYGRNLVVDHSGYPDYGGPLFWSQYSFLGLNPENLADSLVNYENVVSNHVWINYSYCVDNPSLYADYGDSCWGLTSSYYPDAEGNLTYETHCPTDDDGTIAPTAAVSSLPFLPESALAAIRNYYSQSRLWGEAGFYDAFNVKNGKVARAYLAIDQGPQAVMIENYRSGLFWSLFMENSDVRQGLEKLGFSW